MAHAQSLLLRPLRARDNVLRLALDPEVWRKIGKIGDQRDKRRSFLQLADALCNLPVEVGNHRKHHVGRICRPIFTQNVYCTCVKQPDDKLKNSEQRQRNPRPSSAQYLIVGVLNSQPSQLTNYIELIKQLLYV